MQFVYWFGTPRIEIWAISADMGGHGCGLDGQRCKYSKLTLGRSGRPDIWVDALLDAVSDHVEMHADATKIHWKGVGYAVTCISI